MFGIYTNTLSAESTRESLSDLFTRLSLNGTGIISPIEDSIANNIDNIKKTLQTLIILLATIIIAYFISYLHIIPKLFKDGVFKTLNKYPIISIASLIINSIITAIYSYKRCLKSINNITNEFNKKESSKIDSIWGSVPKACNKNLENIFLDIQSKFMDDNIHKRETNNDKNVVHDLEKKLEIKLEKKLEIKLEKLNRCRYDLINLFKKRYAEFNLIKTKLNSINKTKETIKIWESNTKHLLESFNDKAAIQDSIDNYLKKKLEELDYEKLYDKFLIKYRELNIILKFMNFEPNPNFFQKCNICLDNLKDSFLNKCGHTACQKCLEKTHMNYKYHCPICREESDKIYKIYL